MRKVNLFIDMDGVLAVYSKTTTTHMHNEGFFYNRPPVSRVLSVIKDIISKEDYDVYILSSVIDSPYCVPEKERWLDEHLPEIKKENRIFVPYGTVKAEFVQGKVILENKVNVLLDDYTENLVDWKLPHPVPIKILNGINSTKGTWVSKGGNFLDIERYSTEKGSSEIRNLINKER